jgi:transposase
MNSLKPLLKKVEAKLPLLTMIPIKLQNKNSQRTYFPLSTSTVVSKWEEEVIPTNLLKSLKIKLKPSVTQKIILDAWINTSNYVYNKAVESIYKHKYQPNFMNLRDKLVTSNTKKHNTEYITISENIKEISNHTKQLKQQLIQFDKTNVKHKEKPEIIKERNTLMKIIEETDELLQKEKIALRTRAKEMSSSNNEGIFEWELETPKEVRAGAVNDVCKAIKTGMSNLKAGNIKHFRLGYRKKTDNHKSILLPKNFIKNKNGEIHIARRFFKEAYKFKMGKNTMKKHKNIEINNDSRICKQHNEYWLIIPVPYKMSPKENPINYCGVDPGVRTFMTTFGNQGCTEYEHNASLIVSLDKKIKLLKDRRERKTRVTKRRILKVERKKSNIINELHWKTINEMLKMNDFIFYGDIKSHSIVKCKENSTLNRNVNNLKFYKFKERLLFKSIERSKKVYLVNEEYTTQTCSFCGNKYIPGCSKIYNCVLCKRSIGRDVNASKNILMKGIIENL